MKKIGLLPTIFFAACFPALFACMSSAPAGSKNTSGTEASAVQNKSKTAESINWVTFEQAEALSKKKPKKIFVDVYTDWCGWCKKMDKDTFSDPGVAAYINKNYYAVKFNAEGRDPVTLKGRTYTAQPGQKTHELAIELLNGKLGYPTTVYLDENFGTLSPLPGYLTVEQFDKVLRYYGEDNHKKQSYQDFEKTYKAKK